MGTGENQIALYFGTKKVKERPIVPLVWQEIKNDFTHCIHQERKRRKESCGPLCRRKEWEGGKEEENERSVHGGIQTRLNVLGHAVATYLVQNDGENVITLEVKQFILFRSTHPPIHQPPVCTDSWDCRCCLVLRAMSFCSCFSQAHQEWELIWLLVLGSLSTPT